MDYILSGNRLDILFLLIFYFEVRSRGRSRINWKDGQ